MQADPFGAGRRGLDPEFAEKRKFLLGASAGADRQSPGGNPIALAAAQEPVIARAEEGDEFVHHVGRVEREMQPETRKAQADGQGAGNLLRP